MERKEKIDWESIKAAGLAGFIKFQEEMSSLVKSDERWTVEVGDDGVYKSVNAGFYETEAAKKKKGHQFVRVKALMARSGINGTLIMEGDERWEFERSEKLGSEVASILTPLLVQSGLVPMPGTQRRQEGRNSFWSLSWNLYPSNHPVLTRRARNT